MNKQEILNKWEYKKNRSKEVDNTIKAGINPAFHTHLLKKMINLRVLYKGEIYDLEEDLDISFEEFCLNFTERFLNERKAIPKKN